MHYLLTFATTCLKVIEKFTKKLFGKNIFVPQVSDEGKITTMDSSAGIVKGMESSLGADGPLVLTLTTM